jgi:hypothetical protein
MQAKQEQQCRSKVCQPRSERYLGAMEGKG